MKSNASLIVVCILSTMLLLAQSEPIPESTLINVVASVLSDPEYLALDDRFKFKVLIAMLDMLKHFFKAKKEETKDRQRSSKRLH